MKEKTLPEVAVKPFLLRIPEDTLTALRTIADAKGRSVNWLIVRAAKRTVSDHKLDKESKS